MSDTHAVEILKHAREREEGSIAFLLDNIARYQKEIADTTAKVETAKLVIEHIDRALVTLSPKVVEPCDLQWTEEERAAIAAQGHAEPLEINRLPPLSDEMQAKIAAQEAAYQAEKASA